MARPKIDTATFTRERASSISSTTPENEANGPSATRTFSPISNVTDAFGPKQLYGDLTQTNWAITRYVPWSSWASVSTIWPNALTNSGSATLSA